MKVIELNNIYKRYKNSSRDSVSNFNLTIEEGEFIVLVGPSGCGKSTTLRMIAGLESISSGALYINDSLMNDVDAKDRGIAMVFQDYALYPHMNVYKNMEFGLKLKKYTKNERDRRIQQAASILGLSRYLDRKPSDLSGGQRQRVALGRAIVRDADLFLMDEPLSNLDAKLRVHMRTQITELHRRLGNVTIYVTHDQVEAMTMADRIVVMNDGRIQQIGSPDDIYDNPDNVFVAQFMGSPGMNIFKAILEDGEVKIGNNQKLRVPSSVYQSMVEQGYEKQFVYFGIRSEEIHINEEFITAHPDWIVENQVDISELNSNETIIYATLETQHFIVRLDYMNTLSPNDVLKFGFNMEKAYFFDMETEERIQV